MIKIINLRKTYTEGGKSITEALKGITIDFPDKGFVSILGPSGCGKSTFLNLLGILDTPTLGRIYIDGYLVNELNEKQKDELRNKKIGFVFQNYHLIPTLKTKENVNLPLKLNTSLSEKEIEEKTNTKLEEVNLSELKNKKSNQISGGQMQRVAIARALINDPEIILADEPTGALDTKNSLDIMQMLKEISKTRLVIIVTHNVELAEEYSDVIVHLKDGEIEKVDNLHEVTTSDFVKRKFEPSKRKRLFTSNKMIFKLVFKNILSKKLKSALTALANCFGLVALGFVLSLTYGFKIYTDRVSYETASNIPINVPAYSTKTVTEERKDKNQSIEFTNAQEIYPYISAQSETIYTYNTYTQDYFNLLDSIVNDGLASEYLVNYASDFSFNLVTEFPESINHNFPKTYDTVTTNMTSTTSSMRSAYGLPSTIFHKLYGNPDSNYDVIAGHAPRNKNELALVTTSYNALDFNILQNIGFYNMSDSKDDVVDKSLSTKVKPISFNDVLGKKYKVFSNDEYFTKYEYVSEKVAKQKDFFTLTEPVYRNPVYYKANDNEALFNDSSKGIELQIVGILRPKQGTTTNILAPSLCFLSELQDEFDVGRDTTEVATTLKENLVATFVEGQNKRKEFRDDLATLLKEYQAGEKEFSATSFNSLIDNYFRYFYYSEAYHSKTDVDGNATISSLSRGYFSTFLNHARRLGVNLVKDNTKEICSSGDPSRIGEYVASIDALCLNMKQREFYDEFISFAAFLNSYSTVNNIAIFPKGLEQRNKILEILDEFNNSRTNEKEKIFYYENNNSMLKNVGDMVSLTTMVLMIFIVVLIIVACAMNVLFTYNNVLERTKDIGILRAVGTRKFDVMKLFVIESAFMGFLSGLISCLFAWAFCIPVNFLVKQSYGSYFQDNVIAIMTWWHCLILIGLGILLGALSALVPSIQASKKDPVKCLKDE